MIEILLQKSSSTEDVTKGRTAKNVSKSAKNSSECVRCGDGGRETRNNTKTQEKRGIAPQPTVMRYTYELYGQRKSC